MSNSEHASRADGCCRLWPDVNTHFLSLKGLPPDAVPRTAAQQVLHPLLVGFDAIAGCELKEFYRFKMHLQRLPEAPVACPELIQVVAAFRCWVDFDYSGARALFIAHLHEYPGDVLTVFFVHMLDFCTGKTCDLVDVFESAIPVSTRRTHCLRSIWGSSRLCCANGSSSNRRGCWGYKPWRNGLITFTPFTVWCMPCTNNSNGQRCASSLRAAKTIGLSTQACACIFIGIWRLPI